MSHGFDAVPGPNQRRYRSKDHWIITDPDTNRVWIYGRSSHDDATGPEVTPGHTWREYQDTYLFESPADMLELARRKEGELDPARGDRNQRALNAASGLSERSFPALIVVTDGDVLTYHRVKDMTPAATEVFDTVGISFDVEIDGETVTMTPEQYTEYIADQERHQTYGGVPEA